MSRKGRYKDMPKELFKSRRLLRPPDLRGKEIGLFYKSQREKQEKNNNARIKLTIPPAVISALYKNLESIDNFAKKHKYYIDPIKKLNFVGTHYDANFIPLKIDKAIHHIGTKYLNKTDDDVMYVKTKEADDFYNISSSTTSSDDVIFVKPETLDNCAIQENTTNDFVKPEPMDFMESMPVKKETSGSDKGNDFSNADTLKAADLFKKMKKDKVESNDYLYGIPGTSTASSTPLNIKPEYKEKSIGDKIVSFRGTGDYKYGYKDIITGTFEEKLDECLSKDDGISKRTSETDDLSFALYEDHKQMTTRTKYKDFLKFRQQLPAYKKSKELIDAINNNQVIVISGETGCGKSTQVPQMILDDAITKNRGANVKILVTQPRRIAASSLAMRVAEERAERLGSSVGYAVRLEKVEGRPRGSIMFCTTGILLADLEVNQGISGYSHVILDEVHERDCHIDISMCMLKQVLKKRNDLKLILMSATIDSEKLSAYFDNCPMMHIEGLAYPVKDVYLEEILHLTGYKPSQEPKKGYNSKPWHKYTRKGKQQSSEMQKDIQYKAEIAPWLESIKKNIDRDVYQTLQDSRIEDLDIDLVFELIRYICEGPPGAILVFLPGIGDITKLLTTINESRSFPISRCEIYPLHSKLPSLEQHRIFERPPDHMRKIIVATNIAETSITIDDIVYVIDCGKIKYSGLNVEENVATLKTEWVSQANLRQRRGRAGRCQPGVCYHLVTSYRAEKLAERLLPEIQRSNLLEPVLTIKRLRLGLAAEALRLMPAVPAEKTVQWAVKHLQQCGALDDKETLTPLGWHLARLPVHPAAGKLLLLGALFGCLDRAASVAAVWGFKDPFQLVIGKEAKVEAAKRKLTLGEPSDHVAISEAIIQWEHISSIKQKRAFAYENFLSMTTLGLLSDMKRQLGDNLRQMGFLCTGSVKSKWENRNASNLSLFKAIIAASLYPNIATVKWINLNSSNLYKQIRILARTPEEGRISLHPSSVMSNRPKQRDIRNSLCTNPGANWLVYWLKQRSSELFLIDVTLVYTLPLLFFGELNVTQAENPDECLISISTINVCCKKETTQLLYELRSLLDKVLASKIMDSNRHPTKHSKFEELILNAVIKLITAEDEGAEYLGEDEDQSESESAEHESNKFWYK